MWKNDYLAIRETLLANQDIIKLLMERSELIIQYKLLSRPNEPIAKQWKSIIEEYPRRTEEVLTQISHLPAPTEEPTSSQILALKSLCMGGALEVGFNLPAVIQGDASPNATRIETIGQMARRLLADIEEH